MTTLTATVLPPRAELAEIEHLEQNVDVGLAAAVDSLTELRQRRAHQLRGFTLWHEYVLVRFGDALALLRLPDGERLHLVQSMCTPTADRPRGLPVREQARHLGVAVGSVQNDRVQLGLVTPRPRPESAPALPAPDGHVWEQTVEWLRRANAGLIAKHDGTGLTLVELAHHAGWTEGKASGALSDVRRRHLAVRTEDRRAGQRVHLLTGLGALVPATA